MEEAAILLCLVNFQLESFVVIAPTSQIRDTSRNNEMNTKNDAGSMKCKQMVPYSDLSVAVQLSFCFVLSYFIVINVYKVYIYSSHFCFQITASSIIEINSYLGMFQALRWIRWIRCLWIRWFRCLVNDVTICLPAY